MQQCLDDEVDAVLRLQRCFGLEHVDAIDTRLAVNVFGGAQWPLHRCSAACENRYAAVGEITHHARVALREFQRDIPADSRYSDDLYFFG